MASNVSGSNNNNNNLMDDKKLKRLLTCINGGEYHAENRRDLSPSELKDIQEQIEAGERHSLNLTRFQSHNINAVGKGYEVVKRLAELAKQDRRLMTSSAVELLSICAVMPLTKLSLAERQKLRLFSYEALIDICATPMELLQFATLCDKMMEKKGSCLKEGKV